MNFSLSPSPKPQPKSWAISVRCRCRSLDFRVNAANVLPNWGTGGERISVFLRLRRLLLLTVESEFREPTGRDLRVEKKGRLRRLWGSVGKLFGRWRKGRSSRNGKRNRNRRVDLVKGKECGNSERDENWWRYQTLLVPIIGSLSLLFYSSAQRDHKGILIHAFSYLFYLYSFCTITEVTQGSSVAIMILVCIAGLYFSYFSNLGFIAKAAYLGTNWICLLVLIYLVFSKVISSGPTIPIERRRIKLYILLATSTLVLLYKLRRGIPLFLINMAFYGSRAWVSGLLLTTQALLQTLSGSRGKNYAVGALLSSAYFWGKEIANYLVPLLQVYIPKTLLDMTTYIF